MKSNLPISKIFVILGMALISVVATGNMSYAQKKTKPAIRLPKIEHPTKLSTYIVIQNNDMSVFTQVGIPAEIMTLRPGQTLKVEEQQTVVPSDSVINEYNQPVIITLMSKATMIRPSYDSICMLSYVAQHTSRTVGNVVKQFKKCNTIFFPDKQAAENFVAANKLKVDSYTTIPSFNAEIMPTFMGYPANKFNLWCMHQIAAQGLDKNHPIDSQATFGFMVETNGRLTDLKLIDTNNKDFAAKVAVIIRDSGLWTPAIGKVKIPMVFIMNFSKMKEE